MLDLKLCNDRTEVDMNLLARAFSISRTQLEDCLRLGTISYWYERGIRDDHPPHMVFRSKQTERRVVLDRTGNIITTPNKKWIRELTRLVSTASESGLPPSPPSGTDGIDADRLEVFE